MCLISFCRTGGISRFAHREPIVRGINDDGVVRLAAFVQRREDPAHLLVHVRNQSVVFGKLVPDDSLGARPVARGSRRT